MIGSEAAAGRGGQVPHVGQPFADLLTLPNRCPVASSKSTVMSTMPSAGHQAQDALVGNASISTSIRWYGGTRVSISSASCGAFMMTCVLARRRLHRSAGCGRHTSRTSPTRRKPAGRTSAAQARIRRTGQHVIHPSYRALAEPGCFQVITDVMAISGRGRSAPSYAP